MATEVKQNVVEVADRQFDLDTGASLRAAVSMIETAMKGPDRGAIAVNDTVLNLINGAIQAGSEASLDEALEDFTNRVKTIYQIGGILEDFSPNANFAADGQTVNASKVQFAYFRQQTSALRKWFRQNLRG